MDKSKSVVVTGVSSGIGRAIAERLVNDGWRVFGAARNQADATAARDALGASFTPLVLDVTDNATIAAAAELVSKELGGRTLDGLVNNAGVQALGPLRYVSVDVVRQAYEVNVIGPLLMCQAFTPLLGADRALAGKPGKIVNIGSLSGLMSVPFVGGYSMSKYAMEALSDTLRQELLVHGIDVVIVEPATVKTPLVGKITNTDISRYRGTEYAEALEKFIAASRRVGEQGLEPDLIAKLVLQILNDPAPKVRYPVLKKKLTQWTLPRMMNPRTLDRLIAKRIGLAAKRS